ncbi:MAG: hypothetical protein ACM3O7_01565 [Acidobacteriota bacterium]
MDEPRDQDVDEKEVADPALYDLDNDEGESGASAKHRLDADFLLDKVIPDEIDWRDLVRRHPMLSIGLAAGLGFLLGRSKGAAIVAGASAAVTAGVMRQLSDVLDGELFEF